MVGGGAGHVELERGGGAGAGEGEGEGEGGGEGGCEDEDEEGGDGVVGIEGGERWSRRKGSAAETNALDGVACISWGLGEGNRRRQWGERGEIRNHQKDFERTTRSIGVCREALSL